MAKIWANVKLSVNFLVGEYLGRRKTLWLALGVVIVGAVLQTSAFTVPHLIIGRLVTGAGTGLKTYTVCRCKLRPLFETLHDADCTRYQAEMCEGKTRGRLISSEVLFTAVEIVVAYWFDFGMFFAWHLPIALQIVFALFVIVLIFGLPESTRWLMNHGQEQEALEVLCAVYDRQPEK
jgi:Sugar (and other) transporter.